MRMFTLGMAVLAVLAISLGINTASRLSAGGHSDAISRTLAYACGYRAAQEYLMSSMTAVFPGHVPAPEETACKSERTNAAANGFDQP